MSQQNTARNAGRPLQFRFRGRRPRPGVREFRVRFNLCAMLTREKLQTYRQFGGDIDGYAHSHGRGDTSGITDADWQLIDDLSGALFIVASGKASPKFAAAVERRLHDAAADEETRELMRQLARNL